MSITTKITGFAGVAGASGRAVPRILKALVNAQKKLVVIRTPFRTGDLKRSVSTEVFDEGAVLIIGEKYWPFVLEFGSYLEVPERRIEPQKIISDAADRVLEIFATVIRGEIIVTESQMAAASRSRR